MPRYIWKDGRSYGGDVQAIGERLTELASSGLTATEDVVEDARDSSSPLHECFEWRDDVAGHKYRMIQARTLVRAIQVQITESSPPEPILVHTVDEVLGPRYATPQQLRERPDLLGTAQRMAVASVRTARARVAELRRIADTAAAEEADALLARAESRLDE